MYAFEYHRPTSVADAVSLFKGASDGVFLAGGHTLIPTLKQRLASPSDVIDLSKIDELKGIRQAGDSLVIGAMATHGEVAESQTVKSAIPSLAEMAQIIGDAQVRARGTIGGSIANNDPAADYPAAIVALKGSVKTDQREIAGEDFFTGMFETALAEDELVTSVSFSKPAQASYAKFRNPASRYAIVGVYVAKFDDGVRVAVVGAGPVVFRSTEMENALGSNFAASALDGVSVKADGLNSDIHASAEYRAHLVKVMAQRAVAAAS